MMRSVRAVALIAAAILLGAQTRAEPTQPTQPTQLTQLTQPTQPGYSAAGLYNLANSFARSGKPGLAVLNYERARLLAPNDPDIEANLRFVLESAHLPAKSRNGLERVATLMSPRAMAWLGALGILIAGACLLAGEFGSRFRWLRRMAMAAGLGLAGLTVCNAAVHWPTLHAGVVISGTAPVRVSPVPMGDALFVLPEAETVRIKAEHEGFILIETGTGRTGWVSSANLAAVVPRRESKATE
jgi:hypothetical protein